MRTRRLATSALLALVPIGVWAIAASVLPEYLVPAPSRVASELLESRAAFARDLRVTCVESLAGFLLALAGAGIVAIAFRLKPALESALMPYAVSAKSVPVVALAPLLVLWLGNGMLGKIFLAAIICFFPILIGFLDGMKSLPIALGRVAQTWRKNRAKQVVLLEIPHAVPNLLSAMKVAGPLAVVGAVVAEFSGADVGLGHAVLVAAYRADAPLLFAAVILVALVGITLYVLLVGAERLVLRRMRAANVT